MTEVDIHIRRDRFTIRVNETFSGGITGIYGPSGSGKTSLLQAMAGLVTPQQGQISHQGRTLFDAATRFSEPVKKRNIGYVFQEGRLFPHMSVAENLRYGIPQSGPGPVGFDQAVDLLQLEPLLHRKPSSISGGEKQRTALGRALLSNPRMLLLDEPFTALDQQLRSAIIPFILGVHREANIPVWVVSHDLPDLLRLTNRLLLLKDGVCQGHGNYHELLEQDTALSLLGHGPLLNGLEMEVRTAEPGKILLTGKGLELTSQSDGSGLEAGDRVRVGIAATDIALATGKVEGISIRNQVRGTLRSIREVDGQVIALVDAGQPMVVCLTREGMQALQLREGMPVWCLVKSVAVQLVREA